jgi:hypothetical protein
MIYLQMSSAADPTANLSFAGLMTSSAGKPLAQEKHAPGTM